MHINLFFFGSLYLKTFVKHKSYTENENFLFFSKKQAMRLMLHRLFLLILVLVEEEVFFRGVVGPDFLDTLVNVTLVLYLLQVL